MTDTPKPTYTVDEETRTLLEAALNMMSQVAEQQVTDEGLATVYAMANDIAERFGIESRVAHVEQALDGTITVTYTEEDEDDDITPDSGTVH